MTRQTETKIPKHLRSYVVEQNYDKYTPRDHALWRFIMRNAKEYLSEHAHPSFLAGLELTGIPTDQIPRISEMDEKLSKFGWGAVCVCGFIPPLAFLEFQSKHILPIAADMRSVEHFDYTPAPDIVHEAAGHAPILADSGYRDYLVKYATAARRAIFSKEDIRLYEAIRLLSDVKENPDSSLELIQRAEDELKAACNAITWVSEASKIARMNWWTVEYGLIGDIRKPKIYGAGLLSSLGESRDCLDSKVEKIPFGMNCVSTSYDITEPQPQLFVAKDFKQLSDALEELENTLAFRKGGEEGLQVAKKSESVTSTQLDSGVEISGILVDYIFENGKPVFLRWSGPVQICSEGHQLKGQGRERHPEGFSSPVGMWADTKIHPSEMSDKELKDYGFEKNTRCELNFISGFKVSGVLKSWTRATDGSLLLVTWSDCTVTRGTKVYFEPSWGEFDLAVGDSIPSIYGGPADWPMYGEGDFGRASSQPGRMSPYSDKEKHLFSLYAQVRSLRSEVPAKKKVDVLGQLAKIAGDLNTNYNTEWLLGLELFELCHLFGVGEKEAPWLGLLQKTVLDLKQYPKTQSRFIQMGMDLVQA